MEVYEIELINQSNIHLNKYGTDESEGLGEQEKGYK